MAGVILKNVNKVFDNGFHAVRDQTLDIADGEFMVLVGPSGCAKSTTLNMIAGLEDTSSGEIWIGDTLVNDLSPKERDIAMVFQNYALYPHMSVYQNMAFGLKLRKISKGEIDRRVREAARILNLEILLDRKPKALSGGQQQRVAVGRAIVRKPKVFLLDEPLSNLDAKLRVHMRLELAKLHKQLATTIIYVTHDQVEAMTMGDRITVMKDGVIQQVDTPMNLYRFPENRFIATFIGSPTMNILPAEICENAGILVLKLENGRELKLSSEQAEVIRVAGISDVLIGIRPESFQLQPSQNADSGEFNIAVEIVEQMGNEVYVYFSIGLSTFTARLPAETKVEEGKLITLFVNMANCHMFDTNTEKNLML